MAGIPRIHDITTDCEDPPLFLAILPLRARAMNTADYGGPAVAEQQKKAYPDLKPLVLQEPLGKVFDRALSIARETGWKIAAADLAAGRIEATATTRLLRFKDDVVIRLRPEGSATRVDMRSVSRLGKSDLGANAKRIRLFLKSLAGG